MREKIKILWFPRLQPDVFDLHLTTWREMCREFELSGCAVKIAVTGEDKNNILDRECIHVFLIKKKYLRILSFWISGYAKFIYNYFKFRPDIVLLDVFSVWFSVPFVFFINRKTVFLIDNRAPHYSKTSGRQAFRDKTIRYYTKLAYLFCEYFLDGMTVITEYYKEYVHNNFGFPYSSIGVWGSGVDMNKFALQKYENSERPDFLKNKFVIMQHGEFSGNRGIFETIKAVSLTGREDICLFLIGDGSAKTDILRLIERLGMERNVYVLPPAAHPEIPAWISYCDCAVMAYPDIEYWNNNNPIKLLEYLAMGKVIICTDMWTFRTIGDNLKSIYYTKDNDPATIADAITYLYTNREFLNEWGKEGVEVVRKKHTWHHQAKAVLDFSGEMRKNRKKRKK